MRNGWVYQPIPHLFIKFNWWSNNESKGFVRTITKGTIDAVFTTTQVNCFGFFCSKCYGLEVSGLMTSVAKGLRLALTAGAPIVALTSLDFYSVRFFLWDGWVHGDSLDWSLKIECKHWRDFSMSWSCSFVKWSKAIWRCDKCAGNTFSKVLCPLTVNLSFWLLASDSLSIQVTKSFWTMRSTTPVSELLEIKVLSPNSLNVIGSWFAKVAMTSNWTGVNPMERMWGEEYPSKAWKVLANSLMTGIKFICGLL